ncbi:MAG: phosphatidate cytidylyltransferase [Acidimicrobiales bacterium]
MDEYEGGDEGFRGRSRRESAHGRRRGDDYPDGPPAFEDIEPGTRPMHRFPVPGYGDPSELPSVQPLGASDVELPHWAAPPTGEVPLIVPARRAGAAEPSSQRADPGRTRGVGWRDREADWDDADYEPARLGGRDAALGALDEARGDPDELFSFDTVDAAGAAPPVIGGSPVTGAPAGAPEMGIPEMGAPAMAERRPSRRSMVQGRGNRWRPDPDAAQYDRPGGDVMVGGRVYGGEGYGEGYGGEGYGGGYGAEGYGGEGGGRDPAASALRHPGAVPPDGGGRSRSGPVVRTLTGVGIGVLLLVALKVGPLPALALVILLVTMAVAELYGVLRKAGYQPATLVGLVATICLMVAEYLKGEAAIGIVLLLTVAACLLWYLIGVERARPTANLAASVLGFLWVGLLGSFAALLLSPALFPNRHGEAFFLGAVIATVAYDVGALVVGSQLGRHPMAPSVSPNKTWEGMLGGIVVSLIVSGAVVGRIHPWGTASALGLGVVVCVLAPLGDLCESVVKRDLGVKDMGAILPGHGGVLDRIDALLFVIPAAYFLVRLLHLGVG